MEPRLLSPWFIRLRWVAFLGQLLVLFLAAGPFRLSIPWIPILLVLLLIPLSNLCARIGFIDRLSERNLVGGLLAIDTLLLTFVLGMAGGPTNPFTIVYLLHVVLAAVLLTPNWTWFSAVLSCLGFSCLFIFSIPVPEWATHGDHHGFSLHLHGMLVAYITVALLAANFLSRIVGELRRKERRLERLENLAANQQRLAALTTITAGAAHELGTPLATIAVIGRELERSVGRLAPGAEILEDLALLKHETSRCKKVLEELAERTGDVVGESPQSLRVSELLRDAIAPLSSGAQFKTVGAMDSMLSRIPRKALTLAIRALIKNAVEASAPTSGPVEISVRAESANVCLEVSDSGIGMDPGTLERLGEPFYSTKGPGKGMGLGVYLSRLTVEQLGGRLEYSSVPGRGTSARMTIPNDGVAVGPYA